MTFLNVVEIESALVSLAATYPSVTQLITLPYFTAEGRQSHALRIGSGDCPRNAVLIISGAHAREWGGPEICIHFAADLLAAWSSSSGLVYLGTSYSASDIRSIIRHLDVIVFPNINPDGRHFSQTSYAMWRKNRNPASSGGQANRIGVDVNRNYDFLWDFPVAFATAAQSAGTLASNDPSSGLFHGTGPFSEPESKNVLWLFDQFPRITWFMDIHSYGGDILHAWGDDSNQSTTPSMNFTNASWNGQRGVQGDAYGEYIPPYDLTTVHNAGTAISAAIAGVRGESYPVTQSFFLPGWTTYPASGGSDDWAYSRYFSSASKRRIHRKRRVFSYCVEFNRTHTFFPTWAEMENIILDVDAGLVRFCLGAISPYPYLFSFCWWRHFWFERWRRVSLPELWGPYGPWTRITKEIQSRLSAIVAPFLRTIDRIIGGRGGAGT
jgi:murein tripeptide amidase MpaA